VGLTEAEVVDEVTALVNGGTSWEEAILLVALDSDVNEWEADCG
jgi:hypothetical protein